jgi:hypothetical protein
MAVNAVMAAGKAHPVVVLGDLRCFAPEIPPGNITRKILNQVLSRLAIKDDSGAAGIGVANQLLDVESGNTKTLLRAKLNLNLPRIQASPSVWNKTASSFRERAI